MANLVALVDPDPARRSRYVRRIGPLMSPVPGLETGKTESGPFAAMWAASPRAPVSTAARGSTTCVVWGDAFDEGRRLGAEAVSRRWGPALAGERPAFFDGYHAAIVFHAEEGLVAGTDLLGLFPLYYACGEGVTLVASSPELLRYHPLFPAELDEEGLIGSMLVSGPIGNRTLLRKVRRLSAGDMLMARRGADVTVMPVYRMPDTEHLAALPFSEQARILDDAFRGAVRRQIPRDAPVGMLLSGGRDSRLFAGYLTDRGDDVTALTLGRPTDHELGCARAVARELRFRHEVAELEPATFPEAARLHARWEQLGTGFATVHVWSALGPLRRLPPHFVTGYFVDVFLAGRAAHGRGMPFDEFFPLLNHRGVRADRLRRLLRTDRSDELVSGVIERMRAEYEQASPLQAQRGWRFQIANAERHHTGTVPWRLSFASWPVLPFLDRQVLDAIGGLPAASLADRRAQDAILKTRFRALARLPLDRNSDNIEPLILPVRDRIRRGLERGWFTSRRGRGREGEQERRYLYRMYDFNGPGWVAIRRAAETHRDKLADLFDMDELAKLVPAPDVAVSFDDVIHDSFGSKLLVGMMLWGAEHL